MEQLKLISKTQTRFEKNGDIVEKISYVFDKSGNEIVKSIDIDRSITLILRPNSYRNIYDEKGDLVRTSYTYDGVIGSITTYTYDEQGNRTSRNYDYDADGIANRTNVYTYDERGNLTRDSIVGPGGIVSSIVTYTYDEQGNQISKSIDSGADEVVEQITFYAYDEQGNRTSESYDYNADGVADETNTYTYTYDEQGNLTSEIDFGADPLINRINTYTYDEQSNLISESYGDLAFTNIGVEHDGNAHDIISQKYFYKYNSNYDEAGNEIEKKRYLGETGKITYYAHDNNGNLYREININNGNIDQVITYTYDEQGNLISESYDYDYNGVADRIDAYTYNEQGNLSTKNIDSDTDGVADETITYTYDEQDNLITESIDSNADGIADQIMTYAYDNRGNLISESIDFDTDRIANQITTYTYDERGDLTETSYDRNADGFVDLIDKYVFDKDGKLVSETRTDNNENDIDDPDSETITYTYDENGNLVQETVNAGNDDALNSTVTYVYDAQNNLMEEAHYENFFLDQVVTSNYVRSEEFEQPDIIVEESSLLLTQVHRFYQYENGFHLYTADDNEISYVEQQSDAGNLSYSYESEKYQVLADNINLITGEEIEGVKPIYRFFNIETGAHLYTMDENEREYIQDNLDNYGFEGVKYYAFETELQEIETIPVYRMYNTQSGTHLYSSDQNEIDYIQENLPHFSMENNGEAAFHVLEL